MTKTMRTFSLFFLGLLFVNHSVRVWSQQEPTASMPVFVCDETTHDFGRIRETEGYAVHEFVIQNTGTAPLVISHVLTSCGCAQPEWSSRPIEPGKKGFVIVHYDMHNRPGPFTKNFTVYTNENTLRRILTIQGEVIPRPEILNVLFHDTIGTVQMEQAAFHFGRVRPHQVATSEIWIQNFGEELLTLVVENVPDFVEVTIPERLESNFPEKMMVAIDANKVDEQLRGRKLAGFTWKTESASGKTMTQSISVTATFVDDFSGMSPAERADAPVVQLSTPFLDFGKLKNKRVYKELTITNQGKSPLNLQSVTIDDAKVAQITGLKKNTLQPQEAQTIRIYVNPKGVTGTFATDLYVISNDPQTPVQEIQILFEK